MKILAAYKYHLEYWNLSYSVLGIDKFMELFISPSGNNEKCNENC